MSDAVTKIFESLGRIEQKIDSHTEAFNQHIAMDMEAYKAISELRQTAAKQKGFITAMGAIAGGLSYAVGYLAEKIFLPHH
jgi:hypothetical protein